MGKHIDAYAKESNHIDQSCESKFEEFNPTATDDIVITNPTGGKVELELRKPIEVQMAWDNQSDRGDLVAADGVNVDSVFDDALTDVADLALEEAGLGDHPVKPYKLRALMLQTARNIRTYSDLESYISTYSADTISQLGLKAARDQSTYRKAAKALKNEGRYEQVVEATFCAVFALFRHGIPIPQTVKDAYNLTCTDDLAADSFSEDARELSLYALVDRLLNIIVEHLHLDRASNASRDLRSLVGAFAHAAYTGESIEEYQDAARHTFDLDPALSGSMIRKHISKMSLSDVEEMFDDINHALLEYASESDAIPDEPLVSYDLTDVKKFGMHDTGDDYVTEDGRWRFALVSFTDVDLEFAYGLRLLKSEAQRDEELRNIVRTLDDIVEPGLFLADRGFDGVGDFETFRDFFPNTWLAHAQDDSDRGGPTADFTKLQAKLDSKDAAVVRTAGFEDLNPPVKIVGYVPRDKNDESESDDRDDSEEFQSDFNAEDWKDDKATNGTSELDPQFRAFYTDRLLPEDADEREEEIKKLDTLYNGRARIEALFGAIKNRFGVETDTRKPSQKSFYFHMSVLFYNIYKLINTVPAPNNGVEISARQDEVLNVTRMLAFEGPNRSDAINHHQQNTE